MFRRAASISSSQYVLLQKRMPTATTSTKEVLDGPNGNDTGRGSDEIPILCDEGVGLKRRHDEMFCCRGVVPLQCRGNLPGGCAGQHQRSRGESTHLGGAIGQG